MDTPPAPTSSTPILVIAVVLTAIVVGGVVFFWQEQLKQDLQKEKQAASDQVQAFEGQVANLNAQIAVLTNTPKLSHQEEVLQASITCTDKQLVPGFIQYSYDDPRDYLGTFFHALNQNDRALAALFLKPTDSTQTMINLNRDFSGYTFTPSSWNQNQVTVSLTTLSGTSATAVFTTGKDNGCWKIVRISDPAHLLE